MFKEIERLTSEFEPQAEKRKKINALRFARNHHQIRSAFAEEKIEVVIHPDFPGSGDYLQWNDRVFFEFTGLLESGVIFDSSDYHMVHPAQAFLDDRMLLCLEIAFKRLKEGSKARITCPSSTAYGYYGRGNCVPSEATIVYYMDIIAVNPDNVAEILYNG